MVGYAWITGDTTRHAFLYSNGSLTDLGTLGGAHSYALGINNSGEMAGYSNTSGSAEHAFLHSNGSMTDLGTLGGADSAAFGINDSSQVVGWAFTSGNTAHAFLTVTAA